MGHDEETKKHIEKIDGDCDISNGQKNDLHLGTKGQEKLNTKRLNLEAVYDSQVMEKAAKILDNRNAAYKKLSGIDEV